MFPMQDRTLFHSKCAALRHTISQPRRTVGNSIDVHFEIQPSKKFYFASLHQAWWWSGMRACACACVCVVYVELAACLLVNRSRFLPGGRVDEAKGRVKWDCGEGGGGYSWEADRNIIQMMLLCFLFLQFFFFFLQLHTKTWHLVTARERELRQFTEDFPPSPRLWLF